MQLGNGLGNRQRRIVAKFLQRSNFAFAELQLSRRIRESVPKESHRIMVGFCGPAKPLDDYQIPLSLPVNL
jgi:hypothetical protein